MSTASHQTRHVPMMQTKKKQNAATGLTPAGGNLFDRWLEGGSANVGRHLLLLLAEKDGVRDGIVGELREVVQSHYVAPEVTAKRLADLGAPQTAALLKEHLPTSKRARSGDFGEVLATEIAEQRFKFQVPVRRLRWKDGRNMALRGDDMIGLAREKAKGKSRGKLIFLKGESKSRSVLSASVLEEDCAALDKDRGRPTRHSVMFVADRLREQGRDDLAEELEEAVLHSFTGMRVEHLLFTLTAGNPKKLITKHLEACSKKKRRRNAVGVRIIDHGKFIEKLFGGL